MLIYVLASCSVSESEKKTIEDVNATYSEYELADFDHVINNYVKLKLKNEGPIDTTRIEDVYSSLMLKDRDSRGKRKFGWTHLIIYDVNEKYLFTLTRQGDKFLVFRDSVF